MRCLGKGWFGMAARAGHGSALKNSLGAFYNAAQKIYVSAKGENRQHGQDF